jgi:hypothetical protein
MPRKKGGEMRSVTQSSMKLLWSDGFAPIGDVVVLDKLSGQISRSGPAYARGAARQNAAIRQVDFHELNGEAYLMVEGLIEFDKKRLAH